MHPGKDSVLPGNRQPLVEGSRSPSKSVRTPLVDTTKPGADTFNRQCLVSCGETAAGPVVGNSRHMFDHHSREYAEHWREIYKDAREARCPVIASSNYGGYHVLTKHADVLGAATDHRRLSSNRSWEPDGSDAGKGVAIPPRPVRLGFLEMDPPESMKYRRLMNKWFTRPSIERGRDRISEAANWSIDRIAETGSCDAIPDLISPFQRTVLLDMLGLPLDKWQSYREEVAEQDALRDGDESAELVGVRKLRERAALFGWLREHIAAEIAYQRVHGGDGLIADLVAATVDDEPISDEMATELGVMLVGGGDETTIATIASALLHLARNPDERAALIADPSLIPIAVDEILRFYPATFTLARNVVEPVEFSGESFEPGDRLLLAFGSANFDADVFDEPEVCDLARVPNPHLTFGAGAHRCIGALLARANVECFLAAFLERVPDFQVAEDAVVPAYEDIARINSFYSVPITFTPILRKGPGEALPKLTAPRIRPV
jgi:cytochrome P450